jgi:hypothetical protein
VTDPCPSQEEDEKEKDEILSSSSSSILSCPFSKSFPRYRIDLTIEKRARNNNNKQSSKGGDGILSMLMGGGGGGFLKSMQIQQLERQLRTLANHNRSNSSQWSIKSNIDGIDALAFFWEQATILMGMKATVHEENDILWIGLPDTSKVLVQNFVEIVEWMTTQCPSNNVNEDDNLDRSFLRASLVEKEGLDIPILCLERIGKSLSSSHSSSLDGKEKPTANMADVVNQRTRKWVKRILGTYDITINTDSDPLLLYSSSNSNKLR